MGTRALIGYLDTDGDLKLTSTYNHWDGYPENLGKGLDNFYNSDAKANEIANVGYISYLDPETGEWEAKNKDVADVTQLPDDFNEAMMTIAEKIENYGADYGYVWDNENEEWVTIKNQGIRSMAEDLENALAHLKGKFSMFPERPDQTMEAKDKIKEGTWSVLPKQIPAFIDAIEKIKEEYHNIVGDDNVFNHLDGAIEAAEELMMNTAEVTPEIPGFEGTRDQFDPDEANTYAAFSRMGEGEEEINLSESFIHKMKYRAGIIK